MTRKFMRRNAWKDISNMRKKQPSNCFKSRRHAWMTINLKEEEHGSVGQLSTVCSQIVLKCLYLARIVRPDILWSVNKLARAVTKWTQACDKRLARLISHIHHTSEYRQYCYVGNTAQHCRLALFSNSIKENQRSSTRLVAWHHIKPAHPKPNWRSNQPQSCWVMLITFRRSWSLLCLVRGSTFLRILKPWLRW